ncbi:MAG TPA: hypothetical protein VN047_10685 [Sphingopyxis sp.]|uniref:hypothetical protein n=1 Tax=Sphingopyxis sp. TaxID=1908224 RepID=UPI002C845EF4|nr:hypothetical protein [Sphingopyxis sp.]HWW57345.1 hypothetical protein [Sphingopyxis sp.]
MRGVGHSCGNCNSRRQASLFEDKLNASIAAYRMLKRNIATFDPRSGTGEYFVIPVGEQVHKGVEIEIVGSPVPGLQLVASAGCRMPR